MYDGEGASDVAVPGRVSFSIVDGRSDAVKGVADATSFLFSFKFARLGPGSRLSILEEKTNWPFASGFFFPLPSQFSRML